MPQGRVSVSIKATVSVNKLISYTKSKGARAEFAGDTYAANVKLMKLKASSAKKAMDIIIDQLDHFKNMMFDFELVLGQPKLAGEWGSFSYLANNYIFEGEVNVYTNAYSSNFYTLLASTLNAIELSEQEAMQFKNAGVPATKIIDFFGIKGRRTYPLPWNDAEQYEEKVLSIILKSSHRYSVVEIQNPSNKFYWKNDGFLSKDGKYTIRLDPMHKIFEPFNHFNRGVNCDGLVSEKFKIKEVRIPLTLTKKEQKEVEKGTFTGSTYRVEYGEQNLLWTHSVRMFIPEDRMNSFKGFELVGQSVHGPGNPEKKESANEGTTTVRRATSSSYR